MGTVTFKSAVGAVTLLARMLGGTVNGRSVMIGEDVNINVQFTGAPRFGNGFDTAIRATVTKPYIGWSDNGQWKAVKINAVTEPKPNSSFTRNLVHYECDLQKLADKLKEVIAPMIGGKARYDEQQAATKAKNKAAQDFRQPYIERLVALGLGKQDEHDKRSGAISTEHSQPFNVGSSGTYIKVEFTVPYDKAEKVLQFLSENLK